MTSMTASAKSGRRAWLENYARTLKYALHVIVRPFDGFWDLSREHRGSVAAANTIIFLALLTRVLKLQYTSFQFLVVERPSQVLFVDSHDFFLLNNIISLSRM